MGLTKEWNEFKGRASLAVQWGLYRLVKCISVLVPKHRDPSLWVFGARGGDAFVDNAKYLYLHVAAERPEVPGRPEVRPVWLSKDAEVVARLQAEGYEAYHCYSLRGLYFNLRAGVVFLTQGHRDLAMPCCAGAFTVLLWHGVPLKHVSWDAGFRDEPGPIRAIHADMAGEFDLLTVPGERLVPVFESGLGIDPDRMAVVGYPRNDALFGEIPGEQVGTDVAVLARIRDLAETRSLVFYLPTFREGTDGSLADHLDFDALDAFLADRDAFLVVKTHPKEHFDLPEDCSRVVQLPEATDVYPFLRHADALVTDYSSVYFDYLLRDRPIVFYAYDCEEYRARRGFYFDYESVTPGPVARTHDELLASLDRVLADPHADAPLRESIRGSFLDDDARSTGRSAAVYELVQRRLTDRNRETA